MDLRSLRWVALCFSIFLDDGYGLVLVHASCSSALAVVCLAFLQSGSLFKLSSPQSPGLAQLTMHSATGELRHASHPGKPQASAALKTFSQRRRYLVTLVFWKEVVLRKQEHASNP